MPRQCPPPICNLDRNNQSGIPHPMPSAGWAAIAEAIEVIRTTVFRIAASHQRQRRR